MENKEELMERVRRAIIKGFSPGTPEAEINQPELKERLEN